MRADDAPAAVRRLARPGLRFAAALLAAASLAAAPAPGAVAPLRVDCRAAAGRLVAELDLSPAIDAELERRLESGLATTVQLGVAVLDPAGAVTARAERSFDVRLDLWSEVYTVTIREGSGAASSRQASEWAVVRTLLAHPAGFDLGPLSALPERFTVEARLELDPVTAARLEKTRAQLTRPAGAWSPLGALAALLLRAPPPEAGRYRSAPVARAGLAAP